MTSIAMNTSSRSCSCSSEHFTTDTVHNQNILTADMQHEMMECWCDGIWGDRMEGEWGGGGREGIRGD